MLSDVGGWGVSEFSGRPIFIYFFIKEYWICTMTRHHAEPNSNIILTKNLPFDCGVRLCVKGLNLLKARYSLRDYRNVWYLIFNLGKYLK